MRNPIYSLIILMAISINQAHAVELVDLVRQAIDNGAASAEMTGSEADKFKNTTKSNQPISAQITIIKKVSPECARLQFKLHQKGAALKDGGTAPITSEFSANFCKYGPPKGFDVAN